MKTSLCLVACICAASFSIAFGQDASPPAASPAPRATPAPRPPEPVKPPLTTFSLDFPGGTPKQLVAAIEKATKRPLNAIIPDEHAGLQLPALKMNNVTVSELFMALANASTRREPYTIDGMQSKITAYGFNTSASSVTDDSIWNFWVQLQKLPPVIESKTCRFFSLAGYLDRGFTVDDITTAIETGWKMQDEDPKPQISFHKETKLLIAVGDPQKLETIDDVLRTLGGATKASAPQKPQYSY